MMQITEGICKGAEGVYMMYTDVLLRLLESRTHGVVGLLRQLKHWLNEKRDWSDGVWVQRYVLSYRWVDLSRQIETGTSKRLHPVSKLILNHMIRESVGSSYGLSLASVFCLFHPI
jgi:hypothetical protein